MVNRCKSLITDVLSREDILACVTTKNAIDFWPLWWCCCRLLAYAACDWFRFELFSCTEKASSGDFHTWETRDGIKAGIYFTHPRAGSFAFIAFVVRELVKQSSKRESYGSFATCLVILTHQGCSWLNPSLHLFLSVCVNQKQNLENLEVRWSHFRRISLLHRRYRFPDWFTKLHLVVRHSTNIEMQLVAELSPQCWLSHEQQCKNVVFARCNSEV